MSKGKSTPYTRTLQAKYAANRRWNRPNQDVTAREYAEARLSDYIQNVVAQAPPLTDEQRERIALLLRTDGSAR